MGKQSLARCAAIAPHKVQQVELLHVAEPVQYGNESNVMSVIIIRWLSIFFCLAFWYSLYTLVV
jgi:hypothetical protein